MHKLIGPVFNSGEQIKNFSRVLLLDIGGTNIRTAVADIGSSDLINPIKQSLNYIDSIEELLHSFLAKDSSIKHLVFSVAGPKIHNSISMTNREFKIDETYILEKFKLDSCHILNDWESIGYSLSTLKNHEINIINKGNSFNNTALVIGPGTGLGAALVIKDDIVLPTEIGNSMVSISKLFEELKLENSNDFNVVESLISGSGLAKIYAFFSGSKKSSEEIIESYKTDEFAQKTIDVFLVSFSQLLSELSLLYMPGKGIYLSGELIRTLHAFLDVNSFMKNFLGNKKTPHLEILKEIPVALINKEMTSLHGSLNFINKFR